LWEKQGAMYTKEESKQLHLDFWTGFEAYSKSLEGLKANGGRWIYYYTGIKNVALKFDVERHLIRVALELNHRDENRRFELYTKLEKYKAIFEESFGAPLIWDYVFTRTAGNEVCRVYTEQAGFDLHRRQEWPQMFDYMARNMLQMEKAFLMVKEVLKND